MLMIAAIGLSPMSAPYLSIGGTHDKEVDMPFGNDCEFSDFDECVSQSGWADDPDSYCADLMRETEEG